MSFRSMNILSRIKTFFQRKKKPTESAVIEIQEQPVEKPKVYGSSGRLEIPELGISVPLYNTSSGSAQAIVDSLDSAVYLRWGNGQIAIADHANQANFSNLEYAQVDKTRAFIDSGTSRVPYVCYRSQVGHIKTDVGGNSIFDEAWNPVFWQNAGGLTIYTCIHRSAPNIMDIRLTYWRPNNSN